MCKAGYAGRDCLRLSDMMHSYICADQPPSATCNDDEDVDHEDHKDVGDHEDENDEVHEDADDEDHDEKEQ